MEPELFFTETPSLIALTERLSVRHLPCKRAFDILFSLMVLILGAPFFLLIAVALFLSSPGPILYTQTRIGRGGRRFRCLKFRTMYRGADERLKRLLTSDPALQEEWQQHHKLKNDPRITKVGALLRKTSLDELPQFWNVLRGEMSIVGPRPVVSDEIEKHYRWRATHILSVRPGITGLWQVSGRSDASYEKRIALDEESAASHTLLLDLKLIAKTIPLIASTLGAY